MRWGFSRGRHEQETKQRNEGEACMQGVQKTLDGFLMGDKAEPEIPPVVQSMDVSRADRWEVSTTLSR